MLAQAQGNVVLTGGSTPERAYELAAALRSNWGGTELWWGDERCVPASHRWSNYGMTRRALLDRVDRAPRAVHRIEGEMGAADAAARYDEELRGATLDLVLLGLGPDGHAASLYPHSPALDERKSLAVGAEAKLEPYVDRVTMTIPALESAPLVVWLVTGASKAEAAARAFGAAPDPAVPGSLIRSRNGANVAILDQEAASAIRN